MKKKNKWIFELGKCFLEASYYRFMKLSDFEYGIRIPYTGSTQNDIAFAADWIYIVNIVSAVAQCEPLWRALVMDRLAQSQVAKLAADLRASDFSPITVYRLLFDCFGTDPFANYPFSLEVKAQVLYEKTMAQQ
jgi:hypothetical protein